MSEKTSEKLADMLAAAAAGDLPLVHAAAVAAGYQTPKDRAAAVDEYRAFKRREGGQVGALNVYDAKDRRILISRICSATADVPPEVMDKVAEVAYAMLTDPRTSVRDRGQAAQIILGIRTADVRVAALLQKIDESQRGIKPMSSRERLDALERLLGGDGAIEDPFGEKPK